MLPTTSEIRQVHATFPNFQKFDSAVKDTLPTSDWGRNEAPPPIHFLQPIGKRVSRCICLVRSARIMHHSTQIHLSMLLLHTFVHPCSCDSNKTICALAANIHLSLLLTIPLPRRHPHISNSYTPSRSLVRHAHSEHLPSHRLCLWCIQKENWPWNCCLLSSHIRVTHDSWFMTRWILTHDSWLMTHWCVWQRLIHVCDRASFMYVT